MLAPAAGLGFVLYGGTAIALRLGHRQSADFHFFSDRPLDQQALLSALSFLHHSETLQDQRDTWVILTDREEPAGDQRVKLSFFGGIHHGRVGSPAMTRDGVTLVASLEDLIATKLKVILQRAEAKDYRDIATMIQAGVSLAHGLAAAQLLYEPAFQPNESLKALTYYGDGDLHTLTSSEKQVLIDAAAAIRQLPAIKLRSPALAPG